MQRAEGFYWVKYEGEWTISHYHGKGSHPWELSRTDSEFEEIDERRIERTDKDVIDVIKGQYLKSEPPPDYISNSPYICKPD